MTVKTHSPAHILYQVFIDEGWGVDPGTDSDWQTFINVLPDDDSYRHNALCIYDTTGILDGRLHTSGETIVHPGLQIRCRGKTFAVARTKIAAIANSLDALLRKAVTIDATNYTIQAFNRTGDPLSLGNEEQDRHRRSHMTLNGTITIL